MKRIENLTEEQAVAVVAQLVTFRAVRGAKITRDRDPNKNVYHSFVVEVETYSAEETVVDVTPTLPFIGLVGK